jgi:tripartite-type tricarboxylate transporter receptor subunit TctC
VLAPLPALAWPDRPLRILVGFQAGGGSDVVTRIVAERLRPQLGGATVIVENKPGAAGSVAADVVMGARDGHTLLVLSDSFITASLTNKSVHFQPLRDFKPASLMCEGTLVLLVTPRAPFRDFAGMVAHVRAHPGTVNYVTAGFGGHQHLTGEYISAALKLDMVHVPTRGGAQAVQELLASNMEMGVMGLGPTLPHIRAGRLIPIAVTVASRMSYMPDVPTLMELGLTGFSVGQWFGLAMPIDTPDAVVEQLSRAVAAALDDETTRQRLDEAGYTAHSTTPAEYAEKIRTEETRWRKLIAERGLKVD